MNVPAWFVPTVRSTRWSVLAGAVAGALAALLAVRMATPRPLDSPWAALTLAIVVAGAVVAFADPAGEFMRAVPTPAVRRAVRRMGVVAAPAAAGLAAVAAAADRAYRGGWSVPSAVALAALAMCGVTAHALWSGRRPAADGAAVGAAVVAGWATLGALATELGVSVGWAVMWSRWPVPVLGTASFVTVVALRRQ